MIGFLPVMSGMSDWEVTPAQICNVRREMRKNNILVSSSNLHGVIVLETNVGNRSIHNVLQTKQFVTLPHARAYFTDHDN